MTLRFRLGLYLTTLATALVLLAGVSITTLAGLNQKLSTALQAYDRLRWCYETGLKVIRVRETLLQEPPNDAFVRQRLTAAIVSMDDGMRPTPAPEVRQQVMDHLDQADAAWRNQERSSRPAATLSEIHAAINALSAASHEVRRQIHRIEDQALAAQRRAQWLVGSLAGVLLLGGLGVSILQYRAVMRPVDRLRVSARNLAAGHWHQRVPLGGDRELIEMAEDFNRMAQQLTEVYQHLERKVEDRSRQLVRSERLASVGMLAAGIAHEINNPLAVICGQAELAQRKAQANDPAGPTSQPYQLILEETARCKTITGKLLSLARPTPPSRQPVALNDLVGEAVEAVRGVCQQRGAALSVNLAEESSLWVEADAMEIRQVVVNLLMNGLKAVAVDAGQIEVKTLSDSHEAVLVVADNGQGMATQTLNRVFDPFFTLSDHANGFGHGLGLAVSHTIIAFHGGQMRAESDGPGLGSRLFVHLPHLGGETETLS